MNTPIADLHTHILPNVDDGAPDLHTSLSMLEIASSNGITDIYLTPHCFSFIEESDAAMALEAFHSLHDCVLKKNLSINLRLGCEILCMERWMNRVLRFLSSGQFPSINNSRYVLIEFTSWDIPSQEVYDCINRLLSENWIPVLAHVERYASTFSSVAFVREIKSKGCLCQLNLVSLCEESDVEITDLAKELIAEELIDFIGSDAHNLHHRPPKYEKGLLYLKEHCSSQYLDAILYKNAKRLFE